jgi:N-acetylglutamate synthase-like GNAT family acetyltransferase
MENYHIPMKGELFIRQANVSDIGKILDLFRNCPDPGFDESAIHDALFETIANCFVAWFNGGLIAVQGFRAHAKEKSVELVFYAAAENFRQNGLSDDIRQQMVEFCLERCRDLGYGKIFVLSEKTKPFVALGFEKVPADGIGTEIPFYLKNLQKIEALEC